MSIPNLQTILKILINSYINLKSHTVEDCGINMTKKKSKRLSPTALQKWSDLGEEADHVVPSGVVFTHDVE